MRLGRNLAACKGDVNNSLHIKQSIRIDIRSGFNFTLDKRLNHFCAALKVEARRFLKSDHASFGRVTPVYLIFGDALTPKRTNLDAV